MTDKIADQDYFLDTEGSVTTDEEKAATLLVRKGQEMSKEVADKIGNQVARQSDTALTEEESEEKADGPKANKSAKPTKNKGVK